MPPVNSGRPQRFHSSGCPLTFLKKFKRYVETDITLQKVKMAPMTVHRGCLAGPTSKHFEIYFEKNSTAQEKRDASKLTFDRLAELLRGCFLIPDALVHYRMATTRTASGVDKVAVLVCTDHPLIRGADAIRCSSSKWRQSLPLATAGRRPWRKTLFSDSSHSMCKRPWRRRGGERQSYPFWSASRTLGTTVGNPARSVEKWGTTPGIAGWILHVAIVTAWVIPLLVVDGRSTNPRGTTLHLQGASAVHLRGTTAVAIA